MAFFKRNKSTMTSGVSPLPCSLETNSTMQIYRFLSTTLLFLPLLPLNCNAFEGTVYGMADISYQHVDNAESGTLWELVSNASRIGIKGADSLDKDLQAIYQFEIGVNIDDSAANSMNTFTQRDMFVGLKGSWGDLTVGKLSTPFLSQQKRWDLFNLLSADTNNIMLGRDRSDNALRYRSPNTNHDWHFEFMAIAPGDSDTGATGPSDAYSTSLCYTGKNRNAGLMHSYNIKNNEITRVYGNQIFGSVKIAGMLQKAKKVQPNTVFADGDNSANAWLLSAAYTAGPWMYKLQYAESDANDALSHGKLTTAGIDYNFSKKTKIYGYVSSQNADQTNKQIDYLTVGMKHVF